MQEKLLSSLSYQHQQDNSVYGWCRYFWMGVKTTLITQLPRTYVQLEYMVEETKNN